MTPQDIFCIEKRCKHFKDIKLVNLKKQTFRYVCKAFKNIPEEIRSGENKHSKPLEGQGNEITYEQEST